MAQIKISGSEEIPGPKKVTEVHAEQKIGRNLLQKKAGKGGKGFGKIHLIAHTARQGQRHRPFRGQSRHRDSRGSSRGRRGWGYRDREEENKQAE